MYKQQQTTTRPEDASAPRVQIIPFEMYNAPPEGFHLLRCFPHLDMSEGESSRGSGRCEKARPGRQTERRGLGATRGGKARGGRRAKARVVKPSAVTEQTAGGAAETYCTRSFPEEAAAVSARWTFIDLIIFATVFSAATDVVLWMSIVLCSWSPFYLCELPLF